MLLNLSNKTVFSFFPKKANTLPSCTALLPIPKAITLRVQHQLAIIWFWTVFLLSRYQIADYNNQPPNALNFKVAQSKVNPCTQTHYTEQNKGSKQGLSVGNMVYGKRIIFFLSLKRSILYCKRVIPPTHPSNWVSHMLQHLCHPCKAENQFEKKTLTWSNWTFCAC